MRAPRAYLAGFGTSGSLLAGAALLFLLASAFIGFHGWPQVGDTPSTVAVSVPQAPLGTTTSRAGRVLATATGSRTFGTSSQALGLNSGAAGRLGGTGSTQPVGGRLPGNPTSPGGGPLQVGTTSPTLPGTTTTPGGHTGPTPSRCPAAACAQTPVKVPPTVSKPVHHAAGAVHKVVSTVTGQLPGSGGNSNSGSIVHHVTGAAGGAASSAGSTVHHAASGAGSTVHHAASGAGSTVHRLLP